ncbi:hypothetical protein [Flaviflexus huanghaiensis]|uniref:hypothetical protein n=1 Tax=Flaviflexus huanghaiensis TaxID=1111473 RepID=UPI0015F7AA95|nr:hypothetical protein [Flaviflexus huanghaiensis]
MSRATARWGLATLMAVPATFGTVDFIFAAAALLPWSVFAVPGGRYRWSSH